MRLINNFIVCGIVLVLFSLPEQVASAQESIIWDKAALRDSAVTLLTKYQNLQNKLDNLADESVERDFIALFMNPKVQVINDIDDNLNSRQISVEDFIVRLRELFPQGLNIDLDLAGLSIGQPSYDRNRRYIFRVRLNRSINGISGGRVISASQKIIIRIAFIYDHNSPIDFTICGSELPPKGQDYLTVTASPAYTGFVNPAIGSDERLDLRMDAGYRAGVFYTHYFSRHWGIGSGAQYARESGRVTLDKFDALGGFDPHLSNVVIDNDIWFLEVPLVLSFRTNLSRHLALMAELGISPGIRVFENMVSSAGNTNTSAELNNVFSDPGWIDRMNRFDLDLQGTIFMKYRLTDRSALLAGAGVRQGLSDLDNHYQPDFISSKYQGQYNPLWGAPGKTTIRSFFLSLGVSVLINKEIN